MNNMEHLRSTSHTAGAQSAYLESFRYDSYKDSKCCVETVVCVLSLTQELKHKKIRIRYFCIVQNYAFLLPLHHAKASNH